MIFTYDRTIKKVQTCEVTDFSSQGLFERQDIQVWVEDNPEILGEDLLIITTEYDKFDKTNERLDLLAIDKVGNLVVIELKRDDSGRNVGLQAIKYAAYCSTLTRDDVDKLFFQYISKKERSITEQDAKIRLSEFIGEDFQELSDKPRIIIVSKEYRPEVTASVLWLRKFGIDITCVKLTPYMLDSNKLACEINILIPLPEAKDYIMKAEHKDNVERNITKTQQEYIDFWDELVEKVIDKVPRQYRRSSPRPYFQIPTKIRGIHFEWAFHGRPRSSFRVELHFEINNKKANRLYIEKIRHLVTKLEEMTKEKVIIDADWGRNWSRIYVERKEGTITEELKDWAIEKMEIFINILEPFVDDIEDK